MTVVARAWLTVAHAGGRWTAAEVRAALAEDNGKTVDTSMFEMADNGFLQLYEPDAEHPHTRFGVTLDCLVPRGVVTWEVFEAVDLEAPPSIAEEPVARGMTVRDVLQRAKAVAA